MSWPWSELGLDGPSSLEEVRQAYAKRVKDVHPEEDPEGFQRLHTAYQQARQACRRARKMEPLVEETTHGSQPTQANPQNAELNFDILLDQEEETQKENSRERKKQAQEPELDFDALLNQGETQKENSKEGKKQSQEPEFDFDALLNQEETQEENSRERKKQSQEQKWDFQRIFQEEDIRSMEQNQSMDQQSIAVRRALGLVEMLLEKKCPYQDWERFFTSVVFFRVKWNPRFMTALASALQAEPTLDQEIRKTVCAAYRFRPNHVPKEHLAFYEAISGLKRKQIKQNFRQRHPILFFLMCIVGGILLFGTTTIYLLERPDRQTASKLSQYIQEDYGYPVDSLYSGYYSSPHLFYVPVQQISFTAHLEGERDLSQGQLGYRTDLGNYLLTQKLEAFSATWSDDCILKMTYAEGNSIYTDNIPTTYLFSTNLSDGKDFLAALADEMERLSQENWYDLWKPEFQIQLAVWDMPYFTYQSTDGAFPGDEILTYYQEELSLDIVTSLVEDSDLEELDFGAHPYHMENLGIITLHRDTYALVAGIDDTTHQVTRYYLYNNMYFISTPAADFDPNMGSLDYFHLIGGDSMPEPTNNPFCPSFGIRRHE